MRRFSFTVENNRTAEEIKDINAYYEVSETSIPPPAAFRYFPPQDQIVLRHGHNSQRLIFEGGVSYDLEEEKHLDALEGFLEANRIEYPALCDRASKLRFLQSVKYKTKKAHELLLKHTAWYFYSS